MWKCKSLALLLAPWILFANSTTSPDLFNKDDAAFLISGEFLYWTAEEGGLDYAIRMKKAPLNPSDTYAQGDMEKASFSWDPGYRLSLGYYRAPNFWEADLQWTYIHLSGNGTQKRPPAEQGRFINGTWPQIFSHPLQKATSALHLHYQMIDLLANRVFHLFNNPHLRLRLVGGLTGVWLHQGWNISYFDSEGNSTHISNRWRYWGFGFKGGMTFDWFWGKDFYITGQAVAGTTSGHYHNESKQKVAIRDLRYKDYRLAFTSQFCLGPSYQKSFKNWRIELFLGYEMTLWMNLHEVYRSTHSAAYDSKETWINSSPISLQGLSARGTFNF